MQTTDLSRAAGDVPAAASTKFRDMTTLDVLRHGRRTSIDFDEHLRRLVDRGQIEGLVERSYANQAGLAATVALINVQDAVGEAGVGSFGDLVRLAKAALTLYRDGDPNGLSDVEVGVLESAVQEQDLRDAR